MDAVPCRASVARSVAKHVNLKRGAEWSGADPKAFGAAKECEKKPLKSLERSGWGGSQNAKAGKSPVSKVLQKHPEPSCGIAGPRTCSCFHVYTGRVMLTESRNQQLHDQGI